MEEFDELYKRDRAEQDVCLIGLTEKDQVTASLLATSILARELRGLSRLTSEELLETCSDERKKGDVEGILIAVENLIKVHKKQGQRLRI